MKKQLFFTVLLIQIMQAESSKDSTFMDSFERSLIRSSQEAEQDYKKLSEADQNKLKDIVNQMMCLHFVQRGFSSLEEAMKDEKYQHYKCPNIELCEEIFKVKNGAAQKPSEKHKELVKLMGSSVVEIQQKYQLTKHQAIGLMEYIKYFIVLDQR